MENSQTATGNDLAGLTETIGQGIEGGLFTWREIQEIVMAKTRATAAEADRCIHAHPWRLVCWAGGFGLVLGLRCAPDSRD